MGTTKRRILSWTLILVMVTGIFGGTDLYFRSLNAYAEENIPSGGSITLKGTADNGEVTSGRSLFQGRRPWKCLAGIFLCSREIGRASCRERV